MKEVCCETETALISFFWGKMWFFLLNMFGFPGNDTDKVEVKVFEGLNRELKWR